MLAASLWASSALAIPTTDTSSGSIGYVPGHGAIARSADGQFALAIRIRGQMRHTARAPSSGAARQAFEIRRARIVLAGHLFGPESRFKLELGLSPADLGVVDNLSADPDERATRRTPLLDLYFELRHLRDLTVRIGQYKLPSNRQRVISSGNLQLVDRSIVNPEFTLDRDLAIDLRSRDLFGLDLFRYYLGVAIARGRDSRGFDDFGMMYFGRVEVLPFGHFADYSEVDFARTEKLRASFGAAYAFIDNSIGLRRPSDPAPAEGGTTDNHVVVADTIVKYAGLTLQSELGWRRGRRNVITNNQDVTPARNGWGTMVQLGYLFGAHPIEVAARYGRVRGASGETSLEDRNELGGGLSWYFYEHPFKLQADVFRLWQTRISDGDLRVRVQLQASL
ncbi:MAG: porin [Deltaproteobacteria bacterium]